MLALGVGWRINYSQGYSYLMEDLYETNPTVLFAVPRIFEQIFNKVKQGILEESIASRVFLLSFFNSLSSYAQSFEMGTVGTFSKITHKILDRLLFEKVRYKFGSNIRHCVCGGAPLGADVSRFFHLAGISVLEGYGLSESTGPVCVNRPNEFRFGSVGRPFPSVDIKIGKDSEVLLKGPSIMVKYFGSEGPSSEDFENGYYKTGDIGFFDEDGFLYITDRKKEIIVSSGGKNISPLKIESYLQKDPLIAQAILAGDQRSFAVGLLSLNASFATELARENGIRFQSVEDLYGSPQFKRLLSKRIEKINQKLASFEQLRRFAILNHELSVDAGELTPGFKLRRKFCLKKYSKMIDRLYD
jgi:long-chain acyl-CoA synthetase